MKRQGSAALDLSRESYVPQRPRTEEFDLSDIDEDDARPRAVPQMETAKVDVARDRRITLTSPIPAAMAESMIRERSITPRRDPAAPVAEPVVAHTRRVGDSGPVHFAGEPTVRADRVVGPWRQRAAQRIDEARAALDAGDLVAAVTAAEAALRESDEAPAPGIAEVIEPARSLLTQVFAAFIGPSSGLPILAPRAEEIGRQRLGDRERAVLRRIDGTRTLEELFDGSGVGSMDAH